MKHSGQYAVTVGASLSLSGRFAMQGRDAAQGLALWAESSGAALRLYDDRSLSGQAIENIRRLIPEVDILLGPYGSSLTLAVAPETEACGKTLWNHGGATDEVYERGFRHVVSGLSPASTYLKPLHGLWPDSIHIAALHATQGTFGDCVLSGFDRPVFRIPLGDTALAELRRVKPDALVVVGSFQAETEFLRQRDQFPPSIRYIAAVSAGVQAFRDVLGPRADGIVGPAQWVADEGPFVQQYRTRFGGAPDYPGAGAYAMGLVAAECLRQGTIVDMTTFYGRFRIEPDTGRQVGHQVRLVQWSATSTAPRPVLLSQ